jgi:hypothetical protein
LQRINRQLAKDLDFQVILDPQCTLTEFGYWLYNIGARYWGYKLKLAYRNGCQLSSRKSSGDKQKIPVALSRLWDREVAYVRSASWVDAFTTSHNAGNTILLGDLQERGGDLIETQPLLN